MVPACPGQGVLGICLVNDAWKPSAIHEEDSLLINRIKNMDPNV